MARVLLHLLLVLGLVVNAVSPAAAHVHAKAAHAHGMSMSHAMPAAIDGHAGHHDHAATAGDHAMHAHHAAEQRDTASSNHDCCNGSTCQCGCAMPPAVARDTGIVPAPQATPAQPCDAPVLALIRGGSPPFRPPAA